MVDSEQHATDIIAARRDIGVSEIVDRASDAETDAVKPLKQVADLDKHIRASGR